MLDSLSLSLSLSRSLSLTLSLNLLIHSSRFTDTRACVFSSNFFVRAFARMPRARTLSLTHTHTRTHTHAHTHTHEQEAYLRWCGVLPQGVFRLHHLGFRLGVELVCSRGLVPS